MYQQPNNYIIMTYMTKHIKFYFKVNLPILIAVPSGNFTLITF